MTEKDQIVAAFPELGELDFIAEHGQKEVWRSSLDGENVVLKLIRPAAEDEERLAREIAAVARLQSNYVPRIFDHGQRDVAGTRRLFIVERFISGDTYRHTLASAPKQPLGAVLDLAEILLRACADFEKAQLVHRDIKPENILHDDEGKYWVIDFGIVRFLDMESLTQTSAHWGLATPGYAPREQFRNRKSEIDSRTDLFAVGIVLYEALFGSHPYREGKSDILQLFADMEQRDLPRLALDGDGALGVSELIAALTARFRSRRPRTAADALEWFLEVAAKVEG